MIKIEAKGNFKKTHRYFERILEVINLGSLDEYGRRGVEALERATPVDTGLTASSWDYDIVRKNGSVSVVWKNSNIQDGVNIALIIQYGHGTKNGAYIEGRDYINPALRSIFDDIEKHAEEEVRRA